MTALRSAHQATAFPGSDALDPPGSVGQVSSQQVGSIIRRPDDLRVAYWNVRTRQDIGVQALTIRELQKNNGDITCLSEARIVDSGHSAIKVPDEEACCHLYCSGVVDNTVTTARCKACLKLLIATPLQ